MLLLLDERKCIYKNSNTYYQIVLHIVLNWRFFVGELFFCLFLKMILENCGNWFQTFKNTVPLYLFSIILSLAFASNDRATTMDAICEYQTSRAFCKIYILVPKAARCWSTGNWLIEIFLQVILHLIFLILFHNIYFEYILCISEQSSLSIRYLAGILIGIVLNLYINLRIIDIFPLLSLTTYEHKMSIYLKL